MKKLCILLVFALTSSFTKSLTPFQQSECGKIKSCLSWSPCIWPNCQFAFSWKITEYNYTKYLEIELIGQLTSENAYLALGFSTIPKMIDNGIVACYKENDTTGISAGYNSNHRFYPLHDDSIDSNFFVKQKDDLYGVQYDAKTNVLQCRFLRLFQPTINAIKLKDLSATEYYLLSAKSNFLKNSLTYHRENKRPSKYSYNLTTDRVNSVIGASYLLVKLHACLMIFGWVFCATNGIIIANFYKNYWPKTSWFGEKVWFQLHRIIQIICILCVSSGFIIIFIFVGGYSTLYSLPYSAHPVMGIVATGFMVANPIMALFRCAPNHHSRWIFNRLHLLVGVTAYVLALATAIIGIQLPAAGPELFSLNYPYILVSVYLGLIIILFLYGEIRKISADKTKVFNDSEMSVSSTLVTEINESFKSGYHILAISFFLSFGFGITFILIIALN